MPRYEFVEGKSSKFWEIEKAKNGKAFTVTWGRIGTKGQTQTKKFKDEWQTDVASKKLIEEKLGKGYRIVGGKGGAKPAAKAKPSSSNKELEAAIAEDPDDVQRWLVYADWLQEVGDPRGELIALRAAKKNPKAKAHEKAHADALWGEAKFLTADEPFAGRTWTGGWKGAKPQPYESLSVALSFSKLGFVESADFQGLDEEGHIAGAVSALLEAPIGRFVRSLRFMIDERYEGHTGQPNYGGIVSALVKARPIALQELTFDCGGYQLSWTYSGDLGPLWPTTPHLRRLSINLGNIDLGKRIDLPKLKSLRLETGGLTAKSVKAIAAAEWPELEELVLFFGTDRYGCNVTIKDVKALLAGKFPKLKRLSLCNSEKLQGKIAEELVRSPLVKQLEIIDLSKGSMWDDDARTLIESVATLKKATVDVSENYFSPESEKALRKAFGKRILTDGQRYAEMIDSREQYGQDEWAIKNKETFRYAAVSE